MASELVPMSRVTSCMTAWTALVHVIEADHCRAIEHSEVFSRFRRFQFGDSQGIVVSAVVFDDAIALVDGLLLPFRKYYVSNAEVREVPQGVQPGLYRFYWVITRDTVIREALDVDVIGVVVHAFAPRDVYMDGVRRHGHDYVIVNRRKHPLIFTLWDDFECIEGHVISESMPSMPVIIAVRVKVTTCNYISLLTQPSSIVLVDPDVLEAKCLSAWYDANIFEILQLVFDHQAYADPNVLLPPVRDPTLMAICSLASCTQFDKATAWIKGRVEVAWPVTRFWYLGCPHCGDPYDFADTPGIVCPSCCCGMYHLPRALIRLTVHDDTGYLNAVAFGPEAEKLIGCSAQEIYEVPEHEAFSMCKCVANHIKGKRLLCYLKHSSDLIRSITSTKYTIVVCYPA